MANNRCIGLSSLIPNWAGHCHRSMHRFMYQVHVPVSQSIRCSQEYISWEVFAQFQNFYKPYQVLELIPSTEYLSPDWG